MEVTIGISLGTKTIGVAILFGKELIKWNAHTYPGRWNSKKSKVIINSLSKIFTTYEPTIVAVKVPRDFNLDENINPLIGTINVLAQNFKIRTKYYTLEELKSHYCPNEEINQATLLECIVDRYSELANIYRNSFAGDRAYYAKLIEAVGVAHLGR